MRSITIFIALAYLVFMTACNESAQDRGNGQEHENHREETADHSHDHGEDTHDHGETESGHIHDHGEEGHNHNDDPEENGHQHDETETDHQHGEAAEEDGHDHNDLTAVSDGYHTATVKPADFSFVYKTGGQLLTDNKDEVIITASTSGIVSFSSHLLYPGVEVKTGQQLFIVSGKNMTENNSDIQYLKLKAEYLAAEENFERAKRLIEDKLITREHYLEASLAWEKLRSEYENFTRTISDAGSIVPSPAGGYIKDLYIREGQMVRTGDRIASVMTENKLILKADVPASDFGIIKEIEAANFTTAYSPHVYSTKELNGEIISYGRSTGDDSYYIPLYFRLNFNSDLLPGTFTDIWLKGETINDVLLVPNGALMEEYGKIYVFRAEEDSFEKRYIKCGKTDGYVTHVLEGLAEGDEIVTEGTYRVRLMLQGSDIPEHSHNH